MHSPKRIKITDVNPHLICVLCGGYYVDATTIIECLHSFCKSCIVKYLEKNKYCPICDVQIHKTSPLLNIRSDKTLQNIVYKLVPSLFRNEMERRVDFYKSHRESLPQLPEDRGEVTEATPIFLPDEPMVICLEYQNTPPQQTTKRYLHCPATMTVSHLVKFIRGKYSLSPAHQVNVFFKEDPLMEDISLMDIAYTYQCRRKVPIHLTYRILEMKKKTIRIINFEPKTEVKDDKGGGDSGGEKEWKEVELQISENGVMSVRNLSGGESSPIPAVEAPPVYSPLHTSTMAPSEMSAAIQPHNTCESNLPIDRCPRPLPTPNELCAPASKGSTEQHPYGNMNHLENNVSPVPLTPSLSVELCPPSVTSTAPLLGSQTSIVTSSFPVMSTTSHPSPLHRTVTTEPIVSVCKVSRDQVRKSNSVLEANKLSISRVPPGGMKEKGDILNKIVSKLSPNERVIGNTSVTIRPVSPKMFPGLKPMEMQQNPSPPQMQQHHHQLSHHQHTLQKPQQKPILNKEAQQKPSQGRYKTYAPTTKQWNPSIDRNTMLMKHNSELSKPSKFFRTRNNIPRFLGNPASGVKPMYAAPEEPPPMKQKLTLMKLEPKNVPTSSMPRSPTKLPPPYTPGSPKLNKSFPDPKSFMGVTHRMPPSPAHTASFSPMVTNPYQLLYGGYGGPYAPDPRLLSPEVLRSMCAYHPSLPPSISMLFNPLHSLPRPPLQQEISSVAEPSTPAVQRIPPSKPETLPLPHPPKPPSEDKRSSPAVTAAADTSKQRSPSAITPPKEGPTPTTKENIPSLLPLPSSLPLPPSAPPPPKDTLPLPAPPASPEPVTHTESSSTFSSEIAEKQNSVEKPAINHTDCHSLETTKFDKPTNDVTNKEIVVKNVEGINLNNNIPKECTSPVPASTAPSLEEAVLSPK